MLHVGRQLKGARELQNLLILLFCAAVVRSPGARPEMYEELTRARIAVDGVALGDGIDRVLLEWGELEPDPFWMGTAVLRPKTEPAGTGPGHRDARANLAQRVTFVSGRSLTIAGKTFARKGDTQDKILATFGQPVPGLLESRSMCGATPLFLQWSYRRQGVLVSLFFFNPEVFDGKSQALPKKAPRASEIFQVQGIELRYPAPHSRELIPRHR